MLRLCSEERCLGALLAVGGGAVGEVGVAPAVAWSLAPVAEGEVGVVAGALPGEARVVVGHAHESARASALIRRLRCLARDRRRLRLRRDTRGLRAARGRGV